MSKKTGNWWLVSSGLLFGLYCLNMAIEKIALLSDTKPFFSMDDVGEFMVLFAAVICLVVTMLERKARLENCLIHILTKQKNPGSSLRFCQGFVVLLLAFIPELSLWAL